MAFTPNRFVYFLSLSFVLPPSLSCISFIFISLSLHIIHSFVYSLVCSLIGVFDSLSQFKINQVRYDGCMETCEEDACNDSPLVDAELTHLLCLTFAAFTLLLV